MTRHQDVATQTVDVGGTRFAYRDLGPRDGVPVIFLTHLTAVLDNWDPRVVDGIAAQRRVITFDNRGVGASEGKVPDSVEAMARDTIAFITALGLKEVDLLGLSLGGFVSQSVVQQAPHLVRRMILAGTGPAGGTGIDKITSLTIFDIIRGALTFKDPKTYLFFTRTPNGRQAAKAFLARIAERTEGRDKPISLAAIGRQLKAIKAFGLQGAGRSLPHHPTRAGRQRRPRPHGPH